MSIHTHVHFGHLPKRYTEVERVLLLLSSTHSHLHTQSVMSETTVLMVSGYIWAILNITKQVHGFQPYTTAVLKQKWFSSNRYRQIPSTLGTAVIFSGDEHIPRPSQKDLLAVMITRGSIWFENNPLWRRDDMSMTPLFGHSLVWTSTC